MSVTDRFSRPIAVAAALGGDSHRFVGKPTLLRGETDTLLTLNGYEAFRAAFLLLIRICQDVSVSVPAECGALRADIEDLVRHIVPDSPPRFVDQSVDVTQFDAILSIGTQGCPDLPWTAINSDGWLARVSSRGSDLPSTSNRPNAIGAIGAACFGVGEVFKRLIKLRSDRGALLDATSFSFWTYTTDDQDSGPDLDSFSIDVLLVGCGAIGSGTAYVLSRLPVSGRALALDGQSYKPENFGTSILVGVEEYDRPKAQIVANVLNAKLETRPLPMKISEFAAQYDGSFPDVILSGLDEVDPRHETQGLWPGLIIDGAIGGELSCQVSCHPWASEVACLLCLFQKLPSATLAEMYTRATGLPTQIANDPDAIVTEEVIAAAQPDRRPWLHSHLGKRICSITSEAVVKFLSDEAHNTAFAPAVPFVACLSSCMIVTELFRYTTQGKTLPAPRFQMNLRWGPGRGVLLAEDRKENCFCVQRSKNISTLRKTRGR